MAVKEVQDFDGEMPRFVDLKASFRVEQNRFAGLIQAIGGQVAWAKITQPEAGRKSVEIMQCDAG